MGGLLLSAALLIGALALAQTNARLVAVADTTSALAALGTLAVQPDTNASSYDRTLFGTTWTDDNDEPDGHNGCDTRNDILRRDLTNTTLDPSSNGCTVLTGTLADPYTGGTVSFVRGTTTSNAVQIDHVVALGDAWQTGAAAWTPQQRVAIANDPLNLLAVDQHNNESKGDDDASEWLPPVGDCAYVARQIVVKVKFALWVTQAEHDAMAGVLGGCPGQPLPEDGATALGYQATAPAGGSAGLFTAVAPFRTTGTGAPLSLGPGQAATVQVAGTGTVPAGATGVIVNVTVANTTAPTYLTAYPAGASRPTVSSVNASPGRSVANLAQLALGSDGAISVYNNLGTTTFDLDVVGYFGSASTAGYTALNPTRIIDTRSTGQRIGPAGTLQIPVTGQGGVPADATAIVFNLTAVTPSAVSYLTAYPDGLARPFASNLNVVAGTTTPNLVTVGIGSDGDVAVYNNQGSTGVLADVVGYYSPGSTLQFTGITPGRLFDTRNGLGRPAGKVGSGASITTSVTYYGVPSDAQAVVTHATATGGSTNGDYVTTYPAGQSPPLASTLNADAGKTVANLAIVPVGTSNSISLYNRIGSIDLLDDISGYYSPTYGDTTTPTSPPLYTPPSPPPPAKALSCSASMSNPNPPQYSNDFVLVQTGAGNAAVSATSHYKSTTTTHSGTSDANGSASIEFQLARATVGYRVVVDVTASLNGKTATCSTSFTPS